MPTSHLHIEPHQWVSRQQNQVHLHVEVGHHIIESVFEPIGIPLVIKFKTGSLQAQPSYFTHSCNVRILPHRVVPVATPGLS